MDHQRLPKSPAQIVAPSDAPRSSLLAPRPFAVAAQRSTAAESRLTGMRLPIQRQVASPIDHDVGGLGTFVSSRASRYMIGAAMLQQPQCGSMVQRQRVEAGTAVAQLQGKQRSLANRTGMPDRLKAGLEGLSGFDLSGVKVHYNSAKPAQLNAHAYAQGQHIHLGPGQERHLPHEAWHVVQQMQGRVRPTMNLGGVAINDSGALEREADVMGARAFSV